MEKENSKEKHDYCLTNQVQDTYIVISYLLFLLLSLHTSILHNIFFMSFGRNPEVSLPPKGDLALFVKVE